MEKKIQTIGSLSTPSFSAYLDEILLRDGTIGKRIKIDHPEAAAIVPFVGKNEILMVRQFRYALGRETLEIPAGKVDEGEKPEACARRELLEETGYRTAELKSLYTYAPALGYSNELIHIYSAHQLTEVQTALDEREIISLERMRLSQIKEMIKKGLIIDGKTLIGLYVTDCLPGSL
jgi:ADP-ribose pyrophosphatase